MEIVTIINLIASLLRCRSLASLAYTRAVQIGLCFWKKALKSPTTFFPQSEQAFLLGVIPGFSLSLLMRSTDGGGARSAAFLTMRASASESPRLKFAFLA